MTERKGLSKKIRFEVFKRDNFTCQYCGKKAPDVILHVDHISPVSRGGEDDILNLVTACIDCNLGKSDRELSDDAILNQRRGQLEELQERREQLDMMLEWQRELASMDVELPDKIISFWNELTPSFSLNEAGATKVRKMIASYGAQMVCESMRLSAQTNLVFDKENKPTQESVEKAFSYIARYCIVSRSCEKEPYMKDLYYLRGIMRRRYGRVTEWEALSLLKKAYLLGYGVERLKDLIFNYHSYGGWARDIEDWINYWSKHGK